MRRVARVAFIAGLLGVAGGSVSRSQATFNPACFDPGDSSLVAQPEGAPPDVVDPQSFDADMNDAATLHPPIPVAIPEAVLIPLPDGTTMRSMETVEFAGMPDELLCSGQASMTAITLTNGDVMFLQAGGRSARIVEPGLLEVKYGAGP